MNSTWERVRGHGLAQGDWLPRCVVPIFSKDLGSTDIIHALESEELDLMVLTQSCDLATMKTGLVALCPIFSLVEYENEYPAFLKKGVWENVRKGRYEGLHLLASPTSPENNREAVVVDFRQIFSLPYAYLSKHAEALGERWRLQAPFLEHFSQAFARFFMRVGLPAAIPAYV